MPLIVVKKSKSSGMSLFSIIQEAKIKKELRFYKGKYPCKILYKGKKKALVQWLCCCNVVGNKKVGYKSVYVGVIDIINSYRLLEREIRGMQK